MDNETMVSQTHSAVLLHQDRIEVTVSICEKPSANKSGGYY